MKPYQIAALAKLEANPNRARMLGFVMPTGAGKAFQAIGRILRPVEPTIRADVVDATLDAYMIGRLIRDYGCSKRDIANTFGASRLGRSAPCTILSTSAAWSAL
jgi:superfamily II DNA or RNA helicase